MRSRFIASVVTLSLLISSAAGFVFATRFNAHNKVDGGRFALNKYAQDLTALLEQGKLPAAAGHDAEIKRIVELLSSANFVQPVLVGDDRAAADQIAFGLTRDLSSSTSPSALRSRRVYRLNLDALFARVTTADEFALRLKEVLAEAIAPGNNAILFVDELQQFAGLRAARVAANEFAAALATGKVKVVGSIGALAYANYVEADATVAPFFEAVRVGQTSNIADTNGKLSSDSFVGAKVSPDLQETVDQAKSPSDRVKVILQVDDVKSGRLAALFDRYGIFIGESLAGVGVISVDMPVGALAELKASNETRYMSMDREVKRLSVGHIEATTGSDLYHTSSLLGTL
ncbi:MAG: hypothetical protein ABIP75_11260, partial [Pyrinomonadaceae bacterium]